MQPLQLSCGTASNYQLIIRGSYTPARSSCDHTASTALPWHTVRLPACVQLLWALSTCCIESFAAIPSRP